MDLSLSKYLIFLFFGSWGLISLVYTISPKSLGRTGKLLHRYGWLRQWAMYTKQLNSEKFYRVFIADLDAQDELPVWRELESQFSTSCRIGLNPNFRFNYFIAKSVRKITVNIRKGKNAELNHDVFSYMCAVLSEYPNPLNKSFRKVKLVRFDENHKAEELILSDSFSTQ